LPLPMRVFYKWMNALHKEFMKFLGFLNYILEHGI
jgi:hypothetical protein